MSILSWCDPYRSIGNACSWWNTYKEYLELQSEHVLRIIFHSIIEPSGKFPQQALSLHHKSLKLEKGFCQLHSDSECIAPLQESQGSVWKLESRTSRSQGSLLGMCYCFIHQFLKQSFLVISALSMRRWPHPDRKAMGAEKPPNSPLLVAMSAPHLLLTQVTVWRYIICTSVCSLWTISHFSWLSCKSTRQSEVKVCSILSPMPSTVHDS